MSNSHSGVLEIEIDPKALEHLRKKGDVYLLTDIQNPRYSYYELKDFKGHFKVKFEEFVEICKSYGDAQKTVKELPVEFLIRIFNVASPSSPQPSNLGLYVTKSGFANVEEWLKALNEEEIPECESGHGKTFYLYHIQATT